jgi:TldD protein
MPLLARFKTVAAGVVITLGFASAKVTAADKAPDTASSGSDVILRAMKDELNRTKTLQLNELPKPYFVSYAVDDTYIFNASASLGGLLSSGLGHLRPTTVQIRVGTYQQDNMNCTFSGMLHSGMLPEDDSYPTMRTSFWFTSDSIYKRATEELTLKRNILRDAQNPETAPDFAPANAFVKVDPATSVTGLDVKKWEDVVKRLSSRFVDHPDIAWSTVEARDIYSTFRLVNSEGTTVRIPEVFSDLTIQARAITKDGEYVHDSLSLPATHLKDLPEEAELTRRVDQLASELEAVRKAPISEDYSGPVLFEGDAAAAMVAQVLGEALHLPRKPISQPGQDTGALDSVWGSRLGSKVLPEWITVTDDPTRSEFHGQTLLGSYEADEEGVAPGKLTLVDKGVLKSFYLTRTPVREFHESNGHGRLHGAFGMMTPAIGNLIFQASETVPSDQLKAKLLEMVKTNGLKYGVIVRRLDFPTTLGVSELEEILKQIGSTGASRTITPPILAYRVYPDGHEELVRDVLFKEFSAKDLRSIVAASDTPSVFSFMNNGARFGWPEATSEAVVSSVVSPALLFDNIELTKSRSDSNKLPVVPPPALAAGTSAQHAQAGDR